MQSISMVLYGKKVINIFYSDYHYVIIYVLISQIIIINI